MEGLGKKVSYGDADTLAEQCVAPVVTKMFGEMSKAWVDVDGEHRFVADFGGAMISLSVRAWHDRNDAVVSAHHIVGAGIKDSSLAKEFCAQMNAKVLFGRYLTDGDRVIFVHSLSASAANHTSVRELIGIVASSRNDFPDLASKTGAMPVKDVIEIEEL